MKQAMKEISYKSHPLILNAIYRPAILPEHAGNPLIEALPPFHPAADMVNDFGRFPHYSAEENQKLSAPQRTFAVSRLNGWLEPLTTHTEVIETLGIIVRTGYVDRNPLNPEYAKSLVKFYREAMDGKICPIWNSGASTAPSSSLFGVSGTGKTTVVERTLDFLPPALCHSQYGFVQVVRMKFDCPPDGSIKQLLFAILKKLDSMLGTNYRNEMGLGGTIDGLILDVAKVLASHHLGILVIDEIQNLLDASGVGQAKMINTLVSYINMVKIPLFVIGTPRALRILEPHFREARRIGDHGSFVWDRLPKGDEFEWFLDCLSKYQWTNHPVSLVDLNEVFYQHTQGIHALIVRLSQLAQLRAIRNGSERLTEDLIGEVAQDKFKLMAPMLQALKKGDEKAIATYEDLFHKGLKKINEDVGLTAKLSLLKEQAQQRNQGSFERSRTISALIQMNFEEGPIQKIVSDLFDTDPTLTCDRAVRIILESMHAPNGNHDAVASKSLNDLVREAKASGESPINALDAAGLVASTEGEKGS